MVSREVSRVHVRPSFDPYTFAPWVRLPKLYRACSPNASAVTRKPAPTSMIAGAVRSPEVVLKSPSSMLPRAT